MAMPFAEHIGSLVCDAFVHCSRPPDQVCEEKKAQIQAFMDGVVGLFYLRVLDMENLLDMFSGGSAEDDAWFEVAILDPIAAVRWAEQFIVYGKVEPRL